MDIWSWVYQVETELREKGQERLADIIDDLPTYACDGEHDKVDAIIKEALAEARRHPNKWIEVFLRHWYLQSQVLYRRNTRGMLSEAVDLLNFAHQEETKDCPQSMCAVQDLANCYALKDGPGYVEQRIAVCEESLAKINASWPCYGCINTEYVDALMDNGQYDLAMERLKHAKGQLLARGEDMASDLAVTECELLRKLGRFEEAEHKARNLQFAHGSQAFQRYKQMEIAVSVAYQGKTDEAINESLPFSEIAPHPDLFFDWGELTHLLASQDPQHNTALANARYNRLSDKLISGGAIRDAIQLMNWQADLAMQRDDHFTVANCVTKIRAAIPELNKDLGATDALITLETQAKKRRDDYATTYKIMTAEELLNLPDENLDSIALFDLQLIHEANPDDEQVLLKYTGVLRDNGFDEYLIKLCAAFLSSHEDSPDILLIFGFTLLENHHIDLIDEYFTNILATAVSTAAKRSAHWVLAHRSGMLNAKDALKHVDQILTTQPHARNSLNFAAQLNLELENYAASTRHCTTLIDNFDDADGYHWDRIVAATLENNWNVVRESCAALQFELSSADGPIEEQWETVHVQFHDESNESIELYARRTGPVTARIKSLRQPQRKQYFGHTLVFDPAPLNRLDQKDQEGDACDSEGNYFFRYRVIKTIDTGTPHFVFAIDGVHPGDDALVQLRTTLSDTGAHIELRCSENYRVCNTVNEEEYRGLYMFVAVPQSNSLDTVHAVLMEQSKDYEHPLIWPLLLEKLGLAEDLQRQSQVEKQYGLE